MDNRSPHRAARLRWTGLLPACISTLLLAWACRPAPAADSRSPAGASVLLRLKAEPGTETVYSFSSVLRQEIRTPGLPTTASGMTLTGAVTHTVVRVDPADGAALVGALGRSVLEIREGAHWVQTRHDQTWTAAYRVDARGACRRRASADASTEETLRRRAISQIGEGSTVCAAFPVGAIRVGEEWTGEVAAPMPWGRQPASAVSRLDRIDRDGEAHVAVIRTRVSFQGLSCPGYLPHVLTPLVHLEGTSEGHLDLDRGIWTKTVWDLGAKLEGRGPQAFAGDLHIASRAILQSDRRLSPEETQVRLRRVESLDRALETVYGGEAGKAIAAIEARLAEETDGDWRNGWESTLAQLNALLPRQPAPTGKAAEGPAVRPADAMAMDQADQTAVAGQWEQAAKAYETLAAAYPDSPLAIEALQNAADIQERELGRPAAARTLRDRAIARLEKEAATAAPSSPTAYRLAAAYADAGYLDKAVAAYRRFLAAGAEGAAPVPRLTAAYRLAGLLEKQGQTQAAAQAYLAVIALPGDDEYARQLREKAREKRLALSQPGTGAAGTAETAPKGGSR